MDHEKAYDHVVRLAGASGSRLAATPAARAAEAQLTRRLRAARPDRRAPRLPPAGLPRDRLVAARGAGRRAVALAHQPVWFSGDTGPEAVRGQFLHVGNGSEGYVRGLDPAGKVLLISRDSYLDYPDDALYRRLLAWRPAAVLLTTNGGAAAPLDTFFDWEKHEQEPPRQPS